MPLSAQLKLLYPSDWSTIADRVKERAGWRCQQCGVAHRAYGYRDSRGDWHEFDGVDRGSRGHKFVRIILTVHHVVPLEEGGGSDDANLTALCQRCHNRADQAMRQRHAARTRASRQALRRAEAGQGAMPV